MKSCVCASPDSPIEAPRPALHGGDEQSKGAFAPRRLVRKPSKLQTTVEVTRCRFGNTSRQAAPVGYEEFMPRKDWTPIYHAAYHDRGAALRHFLQTGVSPDDAAGTGVPLLCIAAVRGHFEIAKTLLEAGAAINACLEEKKESALHIAIKGSQHDIIDLLLVRGANLEATTTHTGETPLHYAAAGPSSLVLVMKLLKFGAKYDVQDLEGQTPAATALQAHNLHAAVAIINMARGKRTQLAKEKDMLLQHVEKTQDRSSMTNDLIADVFAATCDPDSTVLIEAIKKNDAALVEMFLEKGAYPHRATAKGLLPIFAAVKFADLRILKLLVQHGADVAEQGPGNLNLLQVLSKTASRRSEESSAAMLDYLLAKGADGLALYPDGKTLLHRTVAANHDHTRVVKLLLKHGIDVNAQDDNGNTALHLAATNGLTNTTGPLLNAHADSTVVNSKKHTPLLCAVENQQWPIVPLLAVSPAITSWDAEGSTALHHIAQSIPKNPATWTDIATAAKPFCERDICRSMRDRSGATPLIQAVRTLPEDGLLVIETLLTEGGKHRNCIGHEDHRSRDALYYAATLGKLVFVQVLLEHGAPFVLGNWADGKRQFELPADTKERSLELIIESDRLRKEHATPSLDRETRIEIVAPEQRSNSATSGYRTDWETECKPKPSRIDIRKALATRHLQVPIHRQKQTISSLSFPTHVSSRQQRQEAAALKAHVVLRPCVAVSSTPVNSTRDQDVVKDTRQRASRHRAEEPKATVSKLSLTPGSQDSNSASSFRSLGKQQRPAASTKHIPKVDSIAPAAKLSLPEDKHLPSLRLSPVPAKSSTASPTATIRTASIKVVALPFQRLPKSLENTIKISEEFFAPSASPEPSTSPESLTTISELTMSDSKPVQPARADSGVSLTQDDSTSRTLPPLDQSKSTLDGGASTAKRQSGDELASWLAISNMLERL